MQSDFSIVGFCGSASNPSKTYELTRHLVDRVRCKVDGKSRIHDLGTIMSSLPMSASRATVTPQLQTVLDDIENADALVVASPVYKGSYSGLFKHVIDLLHPTALENRPILIAATGGGHRHALMVEHQMRPLFGFFGALTVPLAIYASHDEFTDGRLTDTQVLQRCETAADQLSALARQGRRSETAPFKCGAAI